MSQLGLLGTDPRARGREIAREGGACFSSCRAHRYFLWRWWGEPLAPARFEKLPPLDSRWCTFVMLNPSTAGADPQDNDPTVSKCIGFAYRWGFAGLVVVNLWPLVSTDPGGLLAGDPRGFPPDRSDQAIAEATSLAGRVVAAWGSHAKLRRILEPRAAEVRRLLDKRSPEPVGHLGLNADGNPKHPLYLRWTTPFVPGAP